MLQEQVLQPLRLTRSERQDYPILAGVSGVLKPGRFTLLLGPPGSGKTTLLKTLAGLTKGNRNTLKVWKRRAGGGGGGGWRHMMIKDDNEQNM